MTSTYPLPITRAMLTPAYVPVFTIVGGTKGDDVDTATAAVVVDDRGVGDYAPRTQAQKATQTGNTLAEDVSRARGWIDPREPYKAKPVAPVVASISPTTGAAAALPMMVTITGTGFSPWSTVYTGGMTTPEAKAEYISPTTMKVPIWAAAPGTVSVAVKDHNVLSNTDKLFTVT